jgi:Galactose oxidase, central domain
MIRRVGFCGLVVAFAAGIASAQPAGSFTPTGSLITPRQFHTATLLPTVKVLLAGGISAYGPNAPGLSSAELYEPSTGTFSATGTMTVPRVSHTATLLPDGRVLIAGGYSGIAGGSFAGASATAELYDPSTGTFTSTGQMSTPRFWHSAALLKNRIERGAVRSHDGRIHAHRKHDNSSRPTDRGPSCGWWCPDRSRR